MKASELRIGNVVSLTNHWHKQSVGRVISTQAGSNKAVREDGITGGFILCEDLKGSPTGICPESCFSGIPLTVEWLIKFGFEKEDLGDDSPYEWFKKDGVIIWDYNGIHWIHESSDQSGIDQSHFLFVHQLQNLYFALTGTELSVGR